MYPSIGVVSNQTIYSSRESLTTKRKEAFDFGVGWLITSSVCVWSRRALEICRAGLLQYLCATYDKAVTSKNIHKQLGRLVHCCAAVDTWFGGKSLADGWRGPELLGHFFFSTILVGQKCWWVGVWVGGFCFCSCPARVAFVQILFCSCRSG